MGRPGYSTRFKLLITSLLAVAIAAFTGAFLTFTTGDEASDVVRSGGSDDFVERLLPAAESQVPQQTTIGIELAVGWDGTLVVNGTEIPPDQLDKTPELGLIQFVPGDDQVIERLQGGRNCVQAVVWPVSESRETAARQVSWCFSVV